MVAISFGVVERMKNSGRPCCSVRCIRLQCEYCRSSSHDVMFGVEPQISAVRVRNRMPRGIDLLGSKLMWLVRALKWDGLFFAEPLYNTKIFVPPQNVPS